MVPDKKIIKFSKNLKDIYAIKTNFFAENELYLKKILKINHVYSKQPIRNFCKNCNSTKLKKIFFQFKISYLLCNNCGHLNGMHKDTNAFSKWLYSYNDGKNYSKNYLNDYNKRVHKIYLPKVEFLKKILNFNDLKILDLGAGGGHFLKALELKKIEGIGYEPNKALVNLGNKKLKKNKLFFLDMQDVEKKILHNNDCQLLSMIGVLEHLTNPNDILNCFSRSKIKYLYISVPIFSLSVFIENSFSKVFPRHLSAAHTHLYTEDSLNFLAKKNNLKIVGEWWFGTDFLDLYRSLINSSSNYNLTLYKKYLDKNFFNIINDLQNVLDKNKTCSEVHILFKKNN